MKREGGRRVRSASACETPVVSIITAVYNNSECLEKTIASVIGQTYPLIEYIVIDGGSSDGTVEVLERYDDVIEYWSSEPDEGIYDALNKGISLARGEWINILGADDVFADESVLAAVFSRSHDSKFLYGDVYYGDRKTIYGGVFTGPRLAKINICQQGIFYRSDLFRMLGPFDCRYTLLADWAYNMKVFAFKDARPEHIDLVIAEYSLGGASNSRPDPVFFEERLQIIRKNMGLMFYLYALGGRLLEKFRANWRKYAGRPMSDLFAA